jgi:hypothetical protein
MLTAACIKTMWAERPASSYPFQEVDDAAFSWFKQFLNFWTNK